MRVYCDWHPDRWSGLRDLLEGDGEAYGYFCGLPPDLRAALRRRNGIRTVEELQSVVCDEREKVF